MLLAHRDIDRWKQSCMADSGSPCQFAALICGPPHALPPSLFSNFRVLDVELNESLHCVVRSQGASKLGWQVEISLLSCLSNEPLLSYTGNSRMTT